MAIKRPQFASVGSLRSSSRTHKFHQGLNSVASTGHLVGNLARLPLRLRTHAYFEPENPPLNKQNKDETRLFQSEPWWLTHAVNGRRSTRPLNKTLLTSFPGFGIESRECTGGRFQQGLRDVVDIE
ncbi:hypothetical protein GWI33_016252 [Rhynchophorus ferrugineus]|uniref:Uncharacterized protein n=1 Tax=Rhynchophorus ferrugineus TaxID=354439 RepID=A0A834M7A3_RHYFE|nr:hypothetical protein GWI33_016252 [Rhynchophorus ferrugineus]